MPSRMNRQFPRPSGVQPAPGGMGPIPASVPQPNIRNREGFPAWTPTEQERVAEVLMLGTFGNAFYAKGSDLAAEAVEVLRKAVVTDPVYVAQAAVLAREEGYIRSAPIVALALLTAGNKDAKDAASRIYLRILRTGDDLRNFVGFVQSGSAGRKFGGVAQRIARDWLRYRVDEYQAMKYAGSTERLSLRNLLRLTHPKTVAPWRNAVYRWLVKGEANAELIPNIAALEAVARLKNEGSVSAAHVANTITNYRLPYEAVVPRLQKKDKATMTALAAVAPYFNLLRGLGEFGRAGVWEDQDAVAKAVATLTNPEIIAKVKVLPFRFITAVKALEGFLPRQLAEALYKAMDLSLVNVPVLSGNVVVAPDVSSSMGMPVGKSTTAAEVAGLFTAALWHRNRKVDIMPFDTEVHGLAGVSRYDSLMTVARAIGRLGGGGTDLAAPVVNMLRNRLPVDLYIALTDNEDWAGRGFLSAWGQYRQQVNPEARAVLVTLVPYGDRPTPPEYPGVGYVYGWSDAVLRYVGEAARPGGRGLVERVKETTIGTTRAFKPDEQDLADNAEVLADE